MPAPSEFPDLARCRGGVKPRVMASGLEGIGGELVARAARGDVDAWRQIVEQSWADWLRLAAASRTLRGLEGDDHPEAIAARVAERLSPSGGGALGQFPSWQERNPGKSFGDWLRIVVRNTARDYARERRGRGSEGDEPSAKRLLNELVSAVPLDRLGRRPPITEAETARQIIEWARDRLPAKQLAALAHWLDGASFDELRAELELATADEARRLVRAAIAVLRREFAVK